VKELVREECASLIKDPCRKAKKLKSFVLDDWETTTKSPYEFMNLRLATSLDE
jgi:hypothetical protein